MKSLARMALVIAAVAPLGGPAQAEPHKVKRGETLASIAHRYACTVEAIQHANHLKSARIKAGTRIEIPDACAAGSKGAAGQGGSRGSSPKPKPPKKQTVVHEVVAGELVADIAKRYGVTPADIKTRNKSAFARGLTEPRVGARLRIVTTDASRLQTKVVYQVQPGDTLARIARRFAITVDDVRRMNPKMEPARLRVGDRLTIYREGGKNASQAIGRPQTGSLVGGEKLLPGPGLWLKAPLYSWGTNETIRALKAVIAEVRKKYPAAHDLVIGDISRETGGPLAPHRSHQMGVDVDLGFYHVRQPPTGPKALLDGGAVPLDLEKTWALITNLAGPSELKTPIEYMFIGYSLQEKLYKWSEKQGVSPEKLEWLFQYPRGNRAMHGVVRHEPGHTNHIHVRFKCPPGDKACVD